MDAHQLAMYRVGVNSHTRDDVTAAVAAHRDLGRDYDDAVAEALVERIGAEIDKRVDARLAQGGAPQPAVRPVGRPAWSQLVMGLGSIGLGIGATNAVASEHSAMLVAFIWIVIAVINVVYARRR